MRLSTMIDLVEFRIRQKSGYKQPSPNERFGGRRGVTRGTLYRYFESSAPVPTFAKPRPTAKPQGVVCNAWAKFSGDLATFDNV